MNYIMSITARDRSGIVAGVTGALLELGGNVAAASQTVHQGFFAMMLLAEFAGELDSERLTRLIHERIGADLHVYITPHHPPATPQADTGQTFMVTSIGPDRPGILHRLTSYLAGRQINVDDLYCTVNAGNFIVICQVTVPASLDVYMLQADLEAVGQEGGSEVHMQHENIFVATNELRIKRKII